MRKQSNGFSLIELLGALVLLGILIGLITTTISIYVRSTNTSISDSQIQAEGLIIVRTIESRIANVNPNRIAYCDDANIELVEINGVEYSLTDCIILKRDGTRVFAEDGTSTWVSDFDSELRLSLESNEEESAKLLKLDDVTVPTLNLNISVDLSNILVEEISNRRVVSVRLVLMTDDGRRFTFRSSNSFSIRTDS